MDREERGIESAERLCPVLTTAPSPLLRCDSTVQERKVCVTIYVWNVYAYVCVMCLLCIDVSVRCIHVCCVQISIMYNICIYVCVSNLCKYIIQLYNI